jgi:hypothetical protein
MSAPPTTDPNRRKAVLVHTLMIRVWTSGCAPSSSATHRRTLQAAGATREPAVRPHRFRRLGMTSRAKSSMLLVAMAGSTPGQIAQKKCRSKGACS